MDGKLLRGNKDRRDSAQTHLTGFLLRTGQGNQTSPGGWWRIRNLIRFKHNQVARLGILVKLGA